MKINVEKLRAACAAKGYTIQEDGLAWSFLLPRGHVSYVPLAANDDMRPGAADAWYPRLRIADVLDAGFFEVVRMIESCCEEE
jgi:hypothetical protein